VGYEYGLKSAAANATMAPMVPMPLPYQSNIAAFCPGVMVGFHMLDFFGSNDS